MDVDGKPSRIVGCLFVLLGGFFALLSGLVVLGGILGGATQYGYMAIFLAFFFMGVYLGWRGLKRFRSRPDTAIDRDAINKTFE